MTADIITMPTPLATLAERLHVGFAQIDHGLGEWIEGTLAVAANLAEARRHFTDNRLFSIWLAENDLAKLSENDRAALISMAANLITLRAVLIEQPEKLHPITIWRKCADRFNLGQVSKNEPSPPKIVNRPEPTPIPLPVESAPAEPAVSVVREGPKPKPENLNTRSPLHGLPRAEEVAAFYLETATRATLGKVFRTRGGRSIWDLVLAAIDGGVVTPTHAVIRPSPPTALTMINLRLVLPDAALPYAMRYNLLKSNDRKVVAEDILPAAIANREAYLANPEDLERIVARHGKPDPATIRVARQEAAMRRAADAGQQRIVVFGELMWPHEQGLYDYDQIRCAIWVFKDFRAIFHAPPGQHPGSQADYIKVSMIWLNQYIARIQVSEPAERHTHKMLRVLALLHKIADLMQRNPTGECVFPYSPKVEGEW